MNNLIRLILKTAVHFLDQTDRFTSDVRDRVSEGVDRAADRVSDLREQAEDLYSGEDHTIRGRSRRRSWCCDAVRPRQR